MDNTQLGFAIGLSLAGFLILLVTIIILIVLKRRKSSEDPSNAFSRGKDSKGIITHKTLSIFPEKRQNSSDSRAAFVDSSLGSNDSSNYIHTSAPHQVTSDGTTSNFWGTKSAITQQFSNAENHKLPRQPFKSTNPSQKSTLEVRTRQKPREANKVAKTPSGGFKVASSEGNKVASGRETIVEEDWKSTVDDIFNSALSLHEVETRTSFYPVSKN